MIDKDIVKNIAEKYLENSAIYLTDVAVRPGNTIIVEIDHDNGINIDDCIQLSRFIESQLDREVEDYELEVGSASLSQPFKIVRQYIKNIGNEVEVLTKDGKKLYGLLKDAHNDGIILTIDKQIKPEGAKRKITIQEDLTFSYNELKYTKYRF